jgi:hypothetical protein
LFAINVIKQFDCGWNNGYNNGDLAARDSIKYKIIRQIQDTNSAVIINDVDEAYKLTH